MIINRANMDALFDTYNVTFTDGMRRAAGRTGEYGVLAEDIAMVMAVTGSATSHSWLEQTPGMKEWVGDRALNNMRLGKLTVQNRDFEETISVGRNDIEDDQYGIFAPRFAMMGANAEAVWLELVIDAILANKDWADGNRFFCKNRPLDPANASKTTITNAVSAAFSRDALKAAITAMNSFALSNGKPAQATPVILLVGPQLEFDAITAIKAELVAETVGGATAAVSNVLRNMLAIRVSNRIQGANWYVLGEKNGMKAAAVQKRRVAKLTRKDKDGDDNVFMQNKFLYGTDCRGEAFLTLPFLAYAGGLASVPEWDKAAYAKAVA